MNLIFEKIVSFGNKLNPPMKTQKLCFLFQLLLSLSAVSFAQGVEPQDAMANAYVYEGNNVVSENFVAAEKEYRKALSIKNNSSVAAHNLGNAYYDQAYYDEALARQLEASKHATTKKEKHLAYHNIGNTLMQKKNCKDAVEAYKNALRNNPSDDETRYNLALAKECAKNEGDGGGDENNNDKKGKDKDEKNDKNKDKEEGEGQNKDKEEGEGQNKEDNKDKDGKGEDKNEDKGDPKNDKNNPNKNDPKDQKGQPQAQPGKLSPQQVKNLLEAMNNEEKKVQEKMNAAKTKGVKIKTEKDW
jgi:tetratricopeptide (TPR) repeat protein